MTSDKVAFDTAYLDSAVAADHSSEWYRERFLVFVDTSIENTSTAVLRHALSSVVSTIEAPFLEEFGETYIPFSDFMCVSDVGANANDTNTIKNFLKNYRSTYRIPLFARIQSQTVSGLRRGVFMGHQLYVPDSAGSRHDRSDHRGRVELVVLPVSMNVDNGDSTRPLGDKGLGRRFKVVMGGNGDLDAGLYLWQDRMVFAAQVSAETALPISLRGEYSGVSDTVKFNNMLVMIAPNGDGQGFPQVLVAESRPDINDLLRNGPAPEENLRTDPHSKIHPVNVTSDGIKYRRSIELEGDSGSVNVRLNGVLQDSARPSWYAELSITPNIAYARLCSRADKIKASYFELLGVLLPSPVHDNRVSEVEVFVGQHGQLIGNSLSPIAQAVLVRSGSRAWQQLRETDEAIVAFRDGGTRQVKLKRKEGFEPISNELQMMLLRRGAKLPWTCENKSHGSVSSHIFEDQLSQQGQVYCLAANSEKPLGYFGCPVVSELPHDASGQPAKFGEGPGSKKAKVIFERSGLLGVDNSTNLSEVEQGFCLDWLDEPIRIARSIRQKREDGYNEDPRMGFAKFWMQWRLDQALPDFLRAEQLLQLRLGRNSQSYYLHLVEKVANQELLTPLVNNSVVRLGPMICRYRCTK